jgi:hypothetical protein
MSHSQRIGKKHNIKVASRSFEDVAKLKYLGTTVTIKISYAKRLRAE